MPQTKRINKINRYVKKLSQTEDKWVSLAIAVGIADEIMKGILPDNPGFHDQLNHYDEKAPTLPEPLPMDIFRTQKQETWFSAHPTLGSARVALNHFSDEKSPIESRLFLFSEKATKQKVSATTQLVSNWEDSDLTRNENYKVAVDFFLTHDTNTLMIVLTDRQKLRVMELNGALSNTQKQILENKLFTIPYVDESNQALPQKIVHDALWNAFQLKEVNNKFYQGISTLHYELVNHLVDENDLSRANAKQFSTRLIGRLLFIWFVRKMELINEEMNYFKTEGISSTDYYKEYLEPLFFHTLNTPIEERIITIKDVKTPYLNGGLFEMKENDYYNDILDFPENYFTKLYNHFNEFNFTVDESSVDYELVAVDPEMLGQVFESLLASQDEKSEQDERKATGSFYTPRYIVDYMSKESIRQYLYREIDNQKYEKGIDDLIDMTDAKFVERKSSSTMDLWGTNTGYVKKEIEKALNKVEIIDPAVGSGAFPMGILQIMSKLYERIQPANRYNGYQVKLNIIENNIYGVDIQPMATEISRLRAWLAIIVDDYQDNQKVNPLPNLEFKFISADSLVELETQGEIWADPKLEQNLSEIREKYFNARTTQSKARWKNKYYTITEQTELFEDKRNEQLKSFDPFSNVSTASFFDSEIMFGISEGFDIVIGNPPYIHFQKMEVAERNFYKDLGYDTYAARGDVYTLFYELGIKLLKKEGILSYITSNKWLKTGYGRKLRNYFIEKVNPLILVDLGDGVFEHATVDTNILILENKYSDDDILAVSLDIENIEEEIANNSVKVKFKTDESWTILNPNEQSIKNKIDKNGIPLKNWDAQISRGLVTGLNDAFIINNKKREELIQNDPNSVDLIRPLLRGQDIVRYNNNFSDLYIIIAYYGSYKILKEQYPAIYSHLSEYESRLRNRAQVKRKPNRTVDLNGPFPGQHHWIELDNNLTVENLKVYQDKKIIWPDIAKYPRFSIAEENYFINNTCYMIAGAPLEIIGFLNSKITSWYVPTIASDLGKSVRYRKQYIEQIPVPDYEKNTKLYNKIKNYIKNNQFDKIDEILFEYYGFTKEEINYIQALYI